MTMCCGGGLGTEHADPEGMSGSTKDAAALVLGAAEGEWARRGPTPIEARDLGLAAATRGRVGGAQLRNTGDTGYALDWHCHDNDLHFLYVLGGSFVLHCDGGEPETMAAGSAASLPALLRHKEYGFSGDFRGLMVTSPAVFDTIPDGGELPERASALEGGREAVVTHEATASAEPRCDLGAGLVTGGAVEIHVARPAVPLAPEPGLACWLMMLAGRARLEPADGEARELGPLDSAWLGTGAGQTLIPSGQGVTVLELRLQPDGASAEGYSEA